MRGEDQKRVKEFVRDEQLHLWTELGDAINSAVNGVWSIRAAGVAHRIVRAARLVGPTPYGEVPWTLLAGDVYEAVLRAGELSPELPDEAEWQRLDDMMAKYGRRPLLQTRFAATVLAIDSDRGWIAQEDQDESGEG